MTVARIRRQVKGPERSLDSTTESEIVVDELDPGTEYEFSITAIGNQDRSSVPHPEFRDATCTVIFVFSVFT